ncbi:UDP-glucuronosyltransferase 2B19 [Papilio xuthus]|uniref:UDP-glucuronosyltransferase 2B19 n=1 Tax=Papilio xuthus TaxID=66420 RepID=A0A194Q839_PAPXU|nr:UDP-glucuronosyltransferase 2B19 [Papilio xuthus]
MNCLHTLLFVTLIFAQNAFAYNILAIVSMPLRSHYMAFQTLFRELAIRGHSVTVMNNYPDPQPVRNLEFIDLQVQNAFRNRTPPMSWYEIEDSRFMHIVNLHRHVYFGPQSTKFDCDNLLSNKNVQRHLAQGKKYDVIFVEQFFSDCGLAYAGVFYDAPIIGITSHVLLPWAYPRLGIPFDFSSDAYYFANAGTNPGLYHRIETVLMHLYLTYGKWLIDRSTYDAFHQHMPNVSLDIEKLATERMKMMFSNQHFSITGARLAGPQVLEIGGIHIDKPKPVPKDIEKFLANATNGAIYVSFGSNLIASTMSTNKMQQFLDAFKKIPQKVLWKLENASLPVGNDNVYTSDWMPQLDLLCHPKVLAFVSHGGMLSISEAAHCGKPLLAMPFFGDQFSNAAAVRSSGIGTTMFFEYLNADNLAEEIKKLTSSDLQKSAKRVSKLWHDRPQSVMNSAIYWTEYVARHGTAPPSLPSKGKTLMQFQLDVVGRDREPGRPRSVFIRRRMDRGRYISRRLQQPAPVAINRQRRQLPQHEAASTAN